MDKAVEEQLEVIAWALGKRKSVLNTSEVSRVLGVSVSTVTSWAAAGIFLDYMKPSEQFRNKTSQANKDQKQARDRSRVLYSTLVIAKFLTYSSIKTA
jgi:transposase